MGVYARRILGYQVLLEHVQEQQFLHDICSFIFSVNWWSSQLNGTGRHHGPARPYLCEASRAGAPSIPKTPAHPVFARGLFLRGRRGQ